MSVTSRGYGTRAEFPPNPKSDDSLLDLVNSRYKYAKDCAQSQHRKCGTYYDQYRMIFRGDYDKHRNVVTLPLTLSTIQSDVARKMNTLYGVWPVVGMFGFGPEDAAVARKNELLVSAQMMDCDSFVKAYDYFLHADMYGTGFCQHGWRYDEEDLIRREQVAAPISRQNIERLKTETITTFDGPDWDVFDMVDAFPQPDFHDIREMGWFVRRMRLDLDDCRVLGRADIYDKAAVNKLETYQLLSDVDSSTAERGSYTNLRHEDRQRERFARPIDIIEMWGKVPSEFVPDDGGTERVITIGNGRVILRNRPNPFWHGHKPVLNYSPVRDPHSIWGMGKAEIGATLNFVANKLACQKLDALDLFIDPMFVANKQSILDRRKLKTKPGGVIWSEGPPKEAIEALIPNLSGVQNAYQEVADIWHWMQRGTGIAEDVVMGMGAPGARTTAREFMGRQESVSVRLLLEARLAEEMFLVPLAQAFRAYNRQFLTVPKQMRILGMNAVVNPVTGQPIPPEELDVNMEDLYMDYDVRAMGSTQAMGKQEKVQRLAGLFQMASTHPAGMALINWMAFFREMFLANELYNTQELLNPPPEQMLALQAANALPGMGANTSGPPEQGEGGGGPPVNLAAGLGGLPPLPG
jgi:hypothetical protein